MGKLNGGCLFIGGHVGGLWAHKEMGRPRAVLGRLRLSIRGRFCCWRCAGDYAWSGAKNSKASILFPGAINQSKVNSLASVTGRLGYAWDRFLG